MARRALRLTALAVKKNSVAGWYPDGNGLYLQIGPTITKSWVYRYTMNGTERRQGLGAYPDTTLEEARTLASASRKLKAKGIDPLEWKRTDAVQRQLEAANTKTFKQCALECIEVKKVEWRNAKHHAQWHNTLKAYAYPTIGDLPVQSIDSALVLKVLKPIWNTKTETAQRVRGRIETILDWAKGAGYRQGDNPAMWRGSLKTQLPDPGKIRKVRHHPALPYADIPEFFDWLKTKDTLASKALAFTILTAVRNGVSRHAVRTEVDLSKPAWTIPESGMKAKREHAVPLSRQALVVLIQTEVFANDERIFPGRDKGRVISETAMRKLLAQFREGLTVHGFRSTFRDWCGEETNYPRELAETAMAHANKDKVEAAYKRGDMFQKRMVLMQHWADYCTSSSQRIDQVAAVSSMVAK
ncbi:MAG: integrase arm-type DNA-binding domain-containing protein [Burkholderiales bacterium]|nr:integrase arm-type DNA-binding domain-containing protein [Burkholderiales bacterium]